MYGSFIGLFVHSSYLIGTAINRSLQQAKMDYNLINGRRTYYQNHIPSGIWKPVGDSVLEKVEFLSKLLGYKDLHEKKIWLADKYIQIVKKEGEEFEVFETYSKQEGGAEVYKHIDKLLSLSFHQIRYAKHKLLDMGGAYEITRRLGGETDEEFVLRCFNYAEEEIAAHRKEIEKWVKKQNEKQSVGFVFLYPVKKNLTFFQSFYKPEQRALPGCLSAFRRLLALF